MTDFLSHPQESPVQRNKKAGFESHSLAVAGWSMICKFETAWLNTCFASLS